MPGMNLKNSQKKVSQHRKPCLRETEIGQDPTGRKSWGLLLMPAVLLPSFLRLSLHLKVPGVLNSSRLVAYLLQAPLLSRSNSNNHPTSLSVRKG